MKIKGLYIKNFKGIEDLAYVPKTKILSVLGENGKGKSSFKEAFYAALTGRFPDNPIMLGKDYCEVVLVLEDGTEISRIQNVDKPNVVSVNGKKTTAKAVSELIENQTGIPKDVFDIISSAEKLESLDNAEFSQLMLAAIKDEMDINTLLKYAGVLTPEVEVALRTLFPEAPETFTFSKINEAYNLAFEQRAVTKRLYAQFKAKATLTDIEKPAKKLSDVEAELHDIIRKETVIEEQKTSLRLYSIALNNRKMAEENIAKIQAEIDSITATRPNPKELEDIQAQISEKNKALIAAKALISTLNENIEVFERTLINLDKPVCPISNKLICTTDKTAVREEIAEIIVSNKEGIEYQENILKKVKEEIDILKEAEGKYNANAAGYNKMILLENQLASLRKTLPKVPDKPKELEDVDYTAEKASLKREIEYIRKYQEHLKDISDFEKISEKLEVDDAIVKLLAPKGEVVISIMNYYLSTFAAAINATAANLRPGFEISFTPVNGVSFLVKTSAKGEYKSFKMLSSGEKVLVVFLMLDLFNQIHNQRVLFLDDIDKLDNEAFSQLLDLIQNPTFVDNYDNIVLLGVNHEDTMKLLSTVPTDVL